MAGQFGAAVGAWFTYIAIVILCIFIFGALISMVAGKEHMSAGKIMAYGFGGMVLFFILGIALQVFAGWVYAKLYMWWRYPHAIMIDTSLPMPEIQKIIETASAAK